MSSPNTHRLGRAVSPSGRRESRRSNRAATAAATAHGPAQDVLVRSVSTGGSGEARKGGAGAYSGRYIHRPRLRKRRRCRSVRYGHGQGRAVVGHVHTEDVSAM